MIGLVWRASAWPGLLVLVVGLALAAVLLVTAPGRRENRRFALFIALEAVNMGTLTGLMRLAGDGATAWGAFSVAAATFPSWFPVYLLALACIRSPLTGWLRRRATTLVLVVAALAGPVFWLLMPHAFQQGLTTGADGGLWPIHGPGILVMFGLLAGLNLFSLAVSISALRHSAPGTAARAKAKSYATAFITFDAGWFVYAAASLLGVASQHALDTVGALLDVLFFTVLSYGILRHQLFDIDLKIKWTINRGTLVGIFLAVFFVVGVIAENWLTDRFGLALGGVAAGLLLFALSPLQRFADRVADKAMPHVTDDDEYRTVRKREVYRAAVESAFRDGAISDVERDVLATLQHQLGLSAPDALAVERAVRPEVT